MMSVRKMFFRDTVCGDLGRGYKSLYTLGYAPGETESQNIPKFSKFQASGPAGMMWCPDSGEICQSSLDWWVWEPQIFQIWSNLLFLAEQGQQDALMKTKFCMKEHAVGLLSRKIYCWYVRGWCGSLCTNDIMHPSWSLADLLGYNAAVNTD